jgi:thioredoxin reductase (NADPH)
MREGGELMDVFDCAIVGAGPAGLTAAVYLARYRRHIVVFDAGKSRAAWIPESHNCPGFPGGISGPALLQKLRAQAAEHATTIVPRTVTALENTKDGFDILDESGGCYRARTVLIATGVVDILPDEAWMDEAIRTGAVRLCAICDGFEASDKSVAVYGPARSALRHALFMRTYSRRVTVFQADEETLSDKDVALASEAAIEMRPQPAALGFDGRRCSFTDADGRESAFDCVYPVLGCHAQSKLAIDVGAETDENGEIRVSPEQMSSVAGLYVAGDVVSALNQISVANGHAGIAATAIHNALPRNFR